MPIITLTLGEYDPDLPPAEWPYTAAVDARNRVIILREPAHVYAPAGGHLILTEITLSGYGQAIDRDLERAFAANEIVGDGVWELLLVDESITDNNTAGLRAQAELQIQATPQAQISFESTTDGWEVGQIIRVVDEVEGIDLQMMINSVTIQAVAPDTLRYQVQAATYTRPTITDLITDTIRDRRRPPSLRPIQFDS